MPLAPWRSPLARALHRNRSLVYARYLQLATVQADGRPANRTVVFRGFLADPDRLKFVTDDRSQKVDQIATVPYGEACWYFPKTREQFRLAGRLTLVRSTDSDLNLQQIRQTAWQELSDAARAQFAWPHPGKPRSPSSEFELLPPDHMPDHSTALSNFCLLLLEPDRVDHLELKGNPQDRSLYDWNGDHWSVQEVNP